MLEQHRPEPNQAIHADSAYIVTELLHGVVQHGTAANADTAALDWPLGGKTGTTDDYTDAWFIGFDPDITVGVWLGFDQKKMIADKATGTTAALPIWTAIMKDWVAPAARRTEDTARIPAARQHRHRQHAERARSSSSPAPNRRATPARTDDQSSSVAGSCSLPSAFCIR